MKSQNPAVGIGLLLLAFATLPALAEDRKTFPGATCQPSQPSTTVDAQCLDATGNFLACLNNLFIRDEAGMMLNNDIATAPLQTWICPILRDVVKDSPTISDADIVVINQNVESRLQCFLKSFDSIGRELPDSPLSPRPPYENGAPPSKPPVPPLPITLTFAGRDEAEFGYNFFLCRVPPKNTLDPSSRDDLSGVVTHQWNEGG
jgi:hypothetical protein